MLTGETGAGKSILLDALGLVLGNRADSGLVRAGERAGERDRQLSNSRRAAGRRWPLLAEAEIALEPGEPLIIRRQLKADGGSRRPSSTTSRSAWRCCASLARFLVELHGQHDDRGLVNPRGHRALLDRFARRRRRAWWRRWHGVARGRGRSWPRRAARVDAGSAPIRICCWRIWPN